MNRFESTTNIQNIVLVGAGGTGAQIARNIARMLHDMKARNMHAPCLHVVDPDIVSVSNIGRQLFSPADIGQPKSRIIARRFGLALGLEITSTVAEFNASKHIPSRHSTLLIGAVDNAAARRAIAEAQVLTIDTGNSHTTGQIAIGNYHDAATVSRIVNPRSSGEYNQLPSPYLVFPDLLIDDPAEAQDTNLSCAQLVALASQHMFINDLMACATTTYIYKLLHRQGIENWLTFVSIDGPTTRSIEISSETIRYYAHIESRKKKAA